MTNEDIELAITYLKEMQETYIEGDEYERHPLPEYYAIETALEALENNKWVPTSERYPKEEDEYKKFLVQDEYGEMSVEKIYYTILVKDIPTRHPYFSGRMRNIVAWKPLPASYVRGK